LLGDIAKPRQGMATANNDYFVKFWFEVDFSKIGLNFHDRESALNSKSKYYFTKLTQYHISDIIDKMIA
ncbi:MAG: hypothetical protein RR483_02450, partial [Clostridia bacterium]